VVENQTSSCRINILLVEDSRADARLIKEILREASRIDRVNLVADGAEAMAALRREGRHADDVRPDLVLLDLNLPKKNGRAVLGEMKKDPVLKTIPVVIVTSSAAECDVIESYNLHANCYITKPLALEDFTRVVRAIEEFWVGIARMPCGSTGPSASEASTIS